MVYEINIFDKSLLVKDDFNRLRSLLLPKRIVWIEVALDCIGYKNNLQNRSELKLLLYLMIMAMITD